MTMKRFLFIYFTFNFDLKGDEDVTDHGDDQHTHDPILLTLINTK